MKSYESIYYVYIKNKGKKSAHWHKTYRSRSDAEDEANSIYTGDQEITIRQYWYNEKGYTGNDTIFTYPIVK